MTTQNADDIKKALLDLMTTTTKTLKHLPTLQKIAELILKPLEEIFTTSWTH